jgi:hypothetical protein
MPFYPETNMILAMTTIRRERRLPDQIIGGEVLVKERDRVDAATVVLRGGRAGNYRFISLIDKKLEIQRQKDLKPEYILVEAGKNVKAGDVLVQKGTNRRAPKLTAPYDCEVIRVDLENAQLIVQENPNPYDVKAVYQGLVSAIRGRREIQIEAVGALIQCAWGNGQNTFGFVGQEPAEGIASIANEEIDQTFRGKILLLRDTLTETAIGIALKQEATGIIAPSMSSTLVERVVKLEIPVVLTEGFGGQKMSEIVYNLLRDNQGRQTAIEARQPDRFSTERPELFIPLPTGNAYPPAPERNPVLAPGVLVRVARPPYAGAVGRVIRVWETPRTLSNGLRLPGAEITLTTGGGKGETVFIPLINLEALGRPPEALDA